MKRPMQKLFTTTALVAAITLAGCNSQQSNAVSNLEKADIFEQQGQFRAASIEYRNAIKADSQNVDTYRAFAQMLNEVGGYEQTVELLEPWLEQGEYNVALELAEAYIGQRKPASAREVLAQYNGDNNAEKFRLRGDSQRLSGLYTEAYESYQEAVRLAPESASAAEGLARIYVALTEYQLAITTVDRFVAEHELTAGLAYAKAQALYEQGKVEESANALTAGLATLPDADVFLPERRDSLIMLTQILTELGRSEEAFAYNRILRERRNEEFDAKAESAIASINSGDLEDAKATLEDLIEQQPDSQLVSLLLGSITLQQGDTETATAYFDRIDAERAPAEFLRLATIAKVDQGQRAQALANLERAMLARPTDVELLSMYGILALSDSREDIQRKGIEALEKALAVDNTRNRLRLAIAQYELANNQPEAAIQRLRRVYELEPNDWVVTQQYVALLQDYGTRKQVSDVRDALAANFADEAYAQLIVALIDYRNGQEGPAIARLDRAADMQPQWAAPLMSKAMIYQAQGNNSKAIDNYIQAARLNPTDIRAVQEAGRLYAQDHSPEEVIGFLQLIAQDYRNLKPAAHTLVAQVYSAQGRFDEAEQVLDGIETPIDATEQIQVQLLLAQGQQLLNQNELGRAQQKIAQAIAIQPSNLNLQLTMVQLMAVQKNFAEARATLTNIEQSQGENLRTVLTRAFVAKRENGDSAEYEVLNNYFERSKDFEAMPALIVAADAGASTARATELVQLWTSREPGNASAWHTKGNLALRAGDEAGARQAYEGAYQLDNQRPDLLNNYAWVLREVDVSKAEQIAREAAELAPENANILDTLGWILHLSGNKQEALQVFERALEIEPNNATIKANQQRVAGS
ncbi:tetratricopeptide repeat protein [Salinibius halmophilus]|uniref:tetratricopeptide repeat protein n=1 Tax=Salinibius halmophilus TaxID=1853216 RepID=UPI000E66DFC7|nr:tetratricopeptide repeat protein [Salinibius halmophilus]